MNALRRIAIAATLSVPGFAHALACDALVSEIEAKFKAGGATSVTLLVVGAGDQVPGSVVGTCDNGHKKIVRVQAASAASAAASRPRTPAWTTECKEGFTGPDCQQRVRSP